MISEGRPPPEKINDPTQCVPRPAPHDLAGLGILRGVLGEPHADLLGSLGVCGDIQMNGIRWQREVGPSPFVHFIFTPPHFPLDTAAAAV